MPKRIYTKEQLDRKRAQEREKRKNETPQQKKKRRDYLREWNKNNKERTLTYDKTWSKRNPERRRLSRKKHYEENKEKILKQTKEYTFNRKKNDSLFKFSSVIRSLVANSFKRGEIKYTKDLSTEDILGCSIEFFITYILNLCPEGITLKDFSRFGYHIDHIIPISQAKTEEEVIKLSYYTNMQPLWWKDNMKKSNKILTNNEHLFLIYY